MKDFKEKLKQLKAPFPESDIEWRVQRTNKSAEKFFCYVVPYITNRAIIDRFNEVFGIGDWKDSYRDWKGKEEGFICTISVWDEDKLEWISKEDGASVTGIEPLKGGLSGSEKRAAVKWGVGQYLYSLSEVKVEIKDRGNNYINAQVKVGKENGKDKFETAKGYWDTPKLPQWALPCGNGVPTSNTHTGTNGRQQGASSNNAGTGNKQQSASVGSSGNVVKAKPEQVNEIIYLLDARANRKSKKSLDTLKVETCKSFNVDKLEDLSEVLASEVIDKLKNPPVRNVV